MPRWLALALCGLGVALVAIALRQSARARATRDWTRTTGRVVVSRVEMLDEATEDRRVRFRPVVRYAYDVRGRTFVSEQLWTGSAASEWEHEGWARSWVERFPAGGEVPVWFDPSDPREAVLVQELPRSQFRVLLAIGAALVAAGVFVLARGAGR